MRLVYEDKVVFREVVHQGVRSAPGGALRQVAGVVLHAGAVPRLAQHLQVVPGARLEALGLQQLAGRLEAGQVVVELLLDAGDRQLEALVRRDEVLCGVYLDVVYLAQQLAGQRVQRDDAVDLVPPELHADTHLMLVGGQYLQGVAPDPEAPPGEVVVVALVLHVDELAHEAVTAAHLPLAQEGDEALVLLRGAQAEYAGDRGDDDHVAAGQQRAGRSVPQLVELVVDVGVLLDVGVGARDVGLRLVVVVVAHEVFDGVPGQEVLELRGKLSGERLVVR